MNLARPFLCFVVGAAAGCGGGSAADGGGAAGDGGPIDQKGAADVPVDQPPGSDASDGRSDGGGKGDKSAEDVVDMRPDFAGDSWPEGWDHDPYAEPDDFDRSACDKSGFASWKPEGIWTTQYELKSPGVVMHRFSKDPVDGFMDATAQTDAMGLRGWLSGSPIHHIVWNDGVAFWSRTIDGMSGEHRVTSWLACKRPDADTVDGLLARCIDGECDHGTFHAIRLQRIGGEAEASGLVKLAEFAGDDSWDGGLTVNVRVSKGNAYLARYWDGLRVVDVSAAASGTLKERSHVPVPDKGGIWNDVKIYKDRWVLMASSVHGMIVIDAADPDAPKVVVDKFPAMDRNVHSIFLEGDIAYLADISFGGILIVDMTVPTAPKKVGEFKIDKAFVHDLTVDGKIGYLNYWDAGMVVVDLSDPAAPKELGRYEYPNATSHASWKVASGGRTFIVHGDEDWAAHMRIVDVDPASGTYLKEIGSLKLRDHVSIHNILCVGPRCYVAWYQDGLRIVDVADGTAPTQVGYYNTWTGKTGGKSFYEGSLGVDVVGGLIYVADTERGLVVLKETP